MLDFEDVRHLLDKFYPHGAKREIWWVTQESYDNNSCNQCGRCCAMFGTGYSIDTFRDVCLDESDPSATFMVDNMVPIPTAEAVARGGDGDGRNFVCCHLLTVDGKCSVYENRPDLCRRHPVVGQSVVAECAFAGIDDYDKSPRGIEDLALERKIDTENKKVYLEKLRRNSEHRTSREENKEGAGGLLQR